MVPWNAQKKEKSLRLARKKSRIKVRPKRQIQYRQSTIWALLAAKLTKSRQKLKMGLKNQAFWSKITTMEIRWNLPSSSRARSRIPLCPNKTCSLQWAISTLLQHLPLIQIHLFKKKRKVQISATKILKFKFRGKMDLQVKWYNSRMGFRGLSVLKKTSQIKIQQ